MYQPLFRPELTRSLQCRRYFSKQLSSNINAFKGNVNLRTINVEDYKKPRKHTVSHYQTIPKPSNVDPMAYLYDNKKERPVYISSTGIPFSSKAANRTQKKVENELGMAIPDTSTKLSRKILDPECLDPEYTGLLKYISSPKRVTQSVWHYDSKVGESLLSNLSKETKEKHGLYETSQEQEDAEDTTSDKTSDEYIIQKYQKIHHVKLIELAEGRPGIPADPHACRVLGLIYFSGERISMQFYDPATCRINEEAGLTPISGLTPEACEARAMYWFSKAVEVKDYDSASILAAHYGLDKYLDTISEIAEAITTPRNMLSQHMKEKFKEGPPAALEETIEKANKLFETMIRTLTKRARNEKIQENALSTSSFPKPPITSDDSLSLAVWYFEEAVRLSKSPSYLSAYINFLVTLDTVTATAMRGKTVDHLLEKVSLELPLDCATVNTSGESIFVTYARFYLQFYIDTFDLSGEACCLMAEFCKDEGESDVWMQLGRENGGLTRKERKMAERESDKEHTEIDFNKEQ